jgi:hypothetical protein
MQQSLLYEAMQSPKHDHGSVTWKTQEGPQPTSQRTVAKSLVAMQIEVKEAFSHIISTRRAHLLPQAEPMNPFS